MNIFKISKSTSNLLNILRWVSAFLVLIGHLRSITFINLPEVHNPNILWKIFYFFTGFGHQAVIVFFALSGFLVGSSILKRYKNRNLSFKKYIIIDRGIRIYLVLIPALILTAILDNIGSNYFNISNIYSHGIDFASMHYSIIDRLNIKTFIGNIFMLQESYVTTFGSNSPLWSLAYEVWYYILFFIVVEIFYVKSINKKVILFTILLSISLILNIKIVLYFTIWLIGVSLWYINFKFQKLYILLAIVFFVIWLIISRIHLLSNNFLEDFILALSIGSLILIIKNNNISFIKFNKLNDFFSKFSYSLYVVHFPIIIFIVSILNETFYIDIQHSPSITRLLYFISILITIYLLAYTFYYFTEKNTKKIQQRFLK